MLYQPLRVPGINLKQVVLFLVKNMELRFNVTYVTVVKIVAYVKQDVELDVDIYIFFKVVLINLMICNHYLNYTNWGQFSEESI